MPLIWLDVKKAVRRNFIQVTIFVSNEWKYNLNRNIFSKIVKKKTKNDNYTLKYFLDLW